MMEAELYNKYYLGKTFTVPHNNITYTFGACKFNEVYISWYLDTGHTRWITHRLDLVLNDINCGFWKLSLTDERKIKLKKLMTQ